MSQRAFEDEERIASMTGSDGALLKGRKVLLRQASSGLSKGRLADRIFPITAPGTYVLDIQGLVASMNGDEEYRILFMRPYLLQTLGCVLGILLGAHLTIGGLVIFFLYFPGV